MPKCLPYLLPRGAPRAGGKEGGPLNIVPLTLKHLTPKFLFWGPFRPKRGAKKHLAPFLDPLSVLEKKLLRRTVPFNKEIRSFTSAYFPSRELLQSRYIWGGAYFQFHIYLYLGTKWLTPEPQSQFVIESFAIPTVICQDVNRFWGSVELLLSKYLSLDTGASYSLQILVYFKCHFHRGFLQLK